MPPAVDPAVLQAVPHRAPILRVHQLVQHDAATAWARGQEPEGDGALPWFAGAIEGLAQSAALLLAHGTPATVDAGPRRGMLVAVKRFTVAAAPPPGATIDYHVRLVRRLGPNALVAGHAEVDGVRCAAGELTLWLAGMELR